MYICIHTHTGRRSLEMREDHEGRVVLAFALKECQTHFVNSVSGTRGVNWCALSSEE